MLDVRTLMSLVYRLWQALESCEVIKVEEDQRLSALGDTIFDMRSRQSSRDVRRADAAARATPRPQGPLQMSGGLRDCRCDIPWLVGAA